MIKQPVGVCIFVLFIFGLKFGALSADNASFLPAPGGPYSVGTTTRIWKDSTRLETYTPQTDDLREMVVQFWYPSDVSSHVRAAPYLPYGSDVIPALMQAGAQFGLKLNLAPDAFLNMTNHTITDAPLAAARPRYPVLIFSPGWGALPEYYTAQLEHLASNGYVIAAINHPYGTPVTNFPDGRIVYGDFSIDSVRVATIWTADQRFVLNQLTALDRDDPDQRFTHRLDLGRVGVFGHSLGGSAATTSCFLDSRFKAGINEEGGLVGSIVQKGLTQPFMLLNSQGSPAANRDFYNNLNGAAYHLEFRGFHHMSFSDMPFWVGATDVFDRRVSAIRAAQLTNAYVLAFFDQYLKGIDQPILRGSSSGYPEVHFESRNT
jgi:dienelactone hydrolase